MSEDWAVQRLSDLADIKHGFAFDGQFFREEPPGEILLTPGNFRIGGGFKDDKFRYYAGPSHQFVLREGDLIVTMTDLSKEGDTLGYPALVPNSRRGRFLHNQRLGKVTIKKGVCLDKRYLYYVLCWRDYRHEILASATGSTVRQYLARPDTVVQIQRAAPC